MSGWRATDTSGYTVYASESQKGYPVVEYSRADALTLGTYSISDLINAKDHNGNVRGWRASNDITGEAVSCC